MGLQLCMCVTISMSHSSQKPNECADQFNMKEAIAAEVREQLCVCSYMHHDLRIMSLCSQMPTECPEEDARPTNHDGAHSIEETSAVEVRE